MLASGIHRMEVPLMSSGAVRIEDYVVTYTSNVHPPRIALRPAGEGDFVSQLTFLPEGDPLPADTAEVLYYHVGDFANVLSLLRSHDSVYFVFNGSDPDTENGLQAGAPVGGRAEPVPA